MSSYIFRGIDAPLWASVKEKAKADGVQLLRLVENLLQSWLHGERHIVSELEREQTRKEWAWEHHAEVAKERDLLVRALSMQFPSHLMKHVGRGGGNRKPVVCIHSPAGQLTWTIPEWLMEIGYAHLELQPNDWDGHKTAEKHERLASLTVQK